MKRNLLIDADVVAYHCASARESAVEWEPGFWTWSVSFESVKDGVLRAVDQIQEKLDADKVTLCLTDPHHNFRCDVYSGYKMNRSTVRRPLVLYHIKEWLIDEHSGVMVPSLEGDDVMGILATRPGKEEKIIVSIDKDMKTIPGKYVRTRAKFSADDVEIQGAWEIVEISEEEADAYFYQQALSGDTTDGYPGCPGIGEGRATEMLSELAAVAPFDRLVTRGKNKGKTVRDWAEYSANTMWEVVVTRYAKAGLGEEEALRQARCARILRNEDYDFKNKKVKLWTPQ